MNQAWRYGLTFMAGSLAGAVVAGAFVGWHWQRNFANWYVMGLMDQANVAREIYSGQGRELADRIRGSLPTYVTAVEREFRNAQGREWALWMVSDAYKAADEDLPEELRELISTLPPKQSCRRPKSGGAFQAMPR